MRGAKGKTTAEKLIDGNPGKRAINKDRLIAPAGEMVPPEYLNEEECGIWCQYVERAAPGQLTPADSELLTTLVQQCAIRNQARRELGQAMKDNLKDDGTGSVMTVETERGWVKNPLITVIDSCAKNIKALASELGFTPISRERITAKREGEQSLKDMLMGDSWVSTEAKLN